MRAVPLLLLSLVGCDNVSTWQVSTPPDTKSAGALLLAIETLEEERLFAYPGGRSAYSLPLDLPEQVRGRVVALVHPRTLDEIGLVEGEVPSTRRPPSTAIEAVEEAQVFAVSLRDGAIASRWEVVPLPEWLDLSVDRCPEWTEEALPELAGGNARFAITLSDGSMIAGAPPLYARIDAAGTLDLLPNLRARAMTEDAAGDVWIATSTTIARLDLSTYQTSFHTACPAQFGTPRSIEVQKAATGPRILVLTNNDELIEHDGTAWRLLKQLNQTTDPINESLTTMRTPNDVVFVGTTEHPTVLQVTDRLVEESLDVDVPGIRAMAYIPNFGPVVIDRLRRRMFVRKGPRQWQELVTPVTNIDDLAPFSGTIAFGTKRGSIGIIYPEMEETCATMPLVEMSDVFVMTANEVGLLFCGQPRDRQVQGDVWSLVRASF